MQNVDMLNIVSIGGVAEGRDNGVDDNFEDVLSRSQSLPFNASPVETIP